jgi:hypothetical protein
VNQTLILYPMLALIGLTFAVVLLAGAKRFRAVDERRVDLAAVTLAWVYVAFRFAHSYVHLTYNRVFHRLAMFAGAYLTLIALWAWLLIRLTVQ